MKEHERLAVELGIDHPQTQEVYQAAVKLAPEGTARRMEQQRQFGHGPFKGGRTRYGVTVATPMQ